MRVSPQRYNPDRFTPGRETQNPLYGRLGGPQGRSGLVRITWPPPGFDLRNVQPLAIPTSLSRPRN